MVTSVAGSWNAFCRWRLDQDECESPGMMKTGVISVLVTTVAVAGMFVLLVLQPPTGLAAPSGLCQVEVGIAGPLFVLSIFGVQPARRVLNERMPALSALL